jgi:hypothetical protein
MTTNKTNTNAKGGRNGHGIRDYSPNNRAEFREITANCKQKFIMETTNAPSRLEALIGINLV